MQAVDSQLHSFLRRAGTAYTSCQKDTANLTGCITQVGHEMPTYEMQLVIQPPPYGDLHQQPTRYCSQRRLWLPRHSTHTGKQQSDLDTCRQLSAHDKDCAESQTCCLGSHCDIKGCAAQNAAVAAAMAIHGQVIAAWSCKKQTRIKSGQL